MTISISIIETGKIQCRPSMLQQPADRPVWLRKLRYMTDFSWAESIPVQSFLISHPEGNILFDTGMSPHTNDSGYFPWWLPIRLTSRYEIKESEAIGAQLREKGIEPKDLKAVIVSHLHYDHSGGLPDLVGTPTYLLKNNLEYFQGTFHAALSGATPNNWPKDFSPSFLKESARPIGPFERSYPITEDGKVVAVETPGHVPGHCSLIVYGDEATYFLTGDATYGLEYLDQELTDGVNDTPLLAVETLRKIKELARQIPLVVLPSHDRESAERLRMNDVYKPKTLENTE
jgi:glyoxylase-like metal-dependent hydrolase (beta-lactamase superfamily II)